MDIFNHNSAEILIVFFIAFTMLQSGLDKILDWKGNVAFITDHFKNSPLKGMVPLLLGTILVMELISGVVMIFGIYELLNQPNSLKALIGLEISAITLIFLLIGQRLAKDYAGAMTIAVYFILNILGIFIIQNNM